MPGQSYIFPKMERLPENTAMVAHVLGNINCAYTGPRTPNPTPPKPKEGYLCWHLGTQSLSARPFAPARICRQRGLHRLSLPSPAWQCRRQIGSLPLFSIRPSMQLQLESARFICGAKVFRYLTFMSLFSKKGVIGGLKIRRVLSTVKG
jgi:hypothetical protein